MFIRNKKGFSLIEILIAVGILASSLVVFITRAENSALMIQRDQEEFVAVTLASNKMIELEKDIKKDLDRGKFADEAAEKGTFDEPFQEYSWEYTIRKVEIPVAESGQEGTNSAVAMSAIKNIMKQISKAVREVKLTVTWGEVVDDKAENSFDLVTHVVNVK
ncbi:type II secretion system GspH family protein [bacterium]|nr:type II secretion system GspH family protein [bacterium]